MSIYKIKIFPLPEAGKCKIKSTTPNLLGFSGHMPLSQLLSSAVVLQRQLQTKHKQIKSSYVSNKTLLIKTGSGSNLSQHP